jgi:XRCC4 coiled-coil
VFLELFSQTQKDRFQRVAQEQRETLEVITDAKNAHDLAMYSKFTIILNEKKTKIRELKNLLEKGTDRSVSLSSSSSIFLRVSLSLSLSLSLYSLLSTSTLYPLSLFVHCCFCSCVGVVSVCVCGVHVLF